MAVATGKVRWTRKPSYSRNELVERSTVMVLPSFASVTFGGDGVTGRRTSVAFVRSALSTTATAFVWLSERPVCACVKVIAMSFAEAFTEAFCGSRSTLAASRAIRGVIVVVG